MATADDGARPGGPAHGLEPAGIIEAYLEGWVTGDSATLLAHAADGYVFDDPNWGLISKDEFESYMETIRAEADRFRSGKDFGRFEDLTEMIIKAADDGTATAWFWWAIAGTPIEGSSIVKASPAGVVSETVCYYGKTEYRKRTPLPGPPGKSEA